MDEIVNALKERAGDILTILFFSIMGVCIYILMQNTDTFKNRVRGAALGFFISLTFSYPLYLVLGRGEWLALAAISSVLTISGQFLPELIQNTVRKYVTNKAEEFTKGGDK